MLATRTLLTTLLAAALVLAAGIPLARAASPLHNPHNPFDVDNNGSIRPRDVLLIANRIQSQQSPSLAGLSAGPTYFWDTTDDNRVTPRDALLVVNHILTVPEPSAILSASFAVVALGGYCWRSRRTSKSS